MSTAGEAPTSLRPKAVQNPLSANPLPPPTPLNTAPSPHWLYHLQGIHDKLMQSFHNRQICRYMGFTVSVQRWSCRARPPPLARPPTPSCSTKAPCIYNKSASPLTGYTTYRMKLTNWCFSFHSCQVVSRSKTGFRVSAHRLTNITLLAVVQATL